MEIKSNVTVVIPCYNDGEYIFKAVNSILNQTLKAERIIIVDDGSGIETKKVLENLRQDYVEIVFQDNSGVCKSRNIGIALANTDYILNLDADDFFHPTFIQKAVDILNNNTNIGVVGCYYKTIRNNKVKKEIIKPLGSPISNFLVKNNAMNCSMYRKICWEQVNGYDECMVNGYEDWEFWFSILKKGWEMHIIKEPLFTYRIKKISRDSIASDKFDIDLKLYIFNKHKKTYVNNFESFVIQSLISSNNSKRENLKRINSLNYRIGRAILYPIRFLKNLYTKPNSNVNE